MATTASPTGGSVGGGRVLSAKAVAGLMEAVGFTDPPETHARVGTLWPADHTVKVGVAIVFAESGGNTREIHHNSDGSTDYGLWQINSVHADLLARYNWKDPKQNTQMAYAIYQAAGNSFSPWSTFNSGAYQAYLGKGNAGLQANIADRRKAVTPSGVPNPLSGLDAIGAAFSWLADAHNWLRVAEVIGGGVAIVLGLYMLAETGAVPAAKPIADAATKTAKHAAEAAALA